MALRTTTMQGAGAGMADNPFGGGAAGGGNPTTALSLANQTQAMGMPVTLPNGTQIRVASQADAQLLQSWWQNQQQQQQSQGLSLGGGGGGGASSSGGGNRALQMAADGAQALSGFLAGRDLQGKVRDYDDAQEQLETLRQELARTTNPSGQQLARLIELQQEVNDTQAAVLETQITALDIQAGAGVARVVGGFMDGSGPSMGGGTGTAVAIGAAGVGAGLLLSRDSRDRRRRR
jgi:hypothetical protein